MGIFWSLCLTSIFFFLNLVLEQIRATKRVTVSASIVIILMESTQLFTILVTGKQPCLLLFGGVWGRWRSLGTVSERRSRPLCLFWLVHLLRSCIVLLSTCNRVVVLFWAFLFVRLTKLWATRGNGNVHWGSFSLQFLNLIFLICEMSMSSTLACCENSQKAASEVPLHRRALSPSLSPPPRHFLSFSAG